MIRTRKTRWSPTASLPVASVRLSGSVRVFSVVGLVLVFVLSGLYLYSVNRSSVQGYAMRTLERDLVTLRKENAALKVREAEIRALTRVETGSAELRMEKVQTTTVLAGPDTVALR